MTQDMKAAEIVSEIREAFDGTESINAEALYAIIEAALASARSDERDWCAGMIDASRADGRRDGLEVAAQMFDERAAYHDVPGGEEARQRALDAAAAIRALIEPGNAFNNAAERSYRMADAMLRARTGEGS